MNRSMLAGVLALAVVGSAQAYGYLTDCPDNAVWANDLPRMRSLKYRTLLGNPPAAATKASSSNRASTLSPNWYSFA